MFVSSTVSQQPSPPCLVMPTSSQSASLSDCCLACKATPATSYRYDDTSHGHHSLKSVKGLSLVFTSRLPGYIYVLTMAHMKRSGICRPLPAHVLHACHGLGRPRPAPTQNLRTSSKKQPQTFRPTPELPRSRLIVWNFEKPYLYKTLNNKTA